MPLTVDASGIQTMTRDLRALPDALQHAAASAADAAVKTARKAAIDLTVNTYNITAEKLSPYVTAQLSGSGKAGASITLRVRAIPLETFHPIVKMQRFAFTDRLGRRVSRLLPAVYFTRLRGGAPQYLRPAFPLHQRTSGLLAASDRIVKRTGQARDKLTTFRFYTFPQKFLRDQLIPAVKDAMPAGFRAEFQVAERLSSGRLHRNEI